MSNPIALIALDQGTTSSRAIGFSSDGKTLSTHQKEHAQHYPQSGWVEHDANEIWQNSLACEGRGRCTEIAQQRLLCLLVVASEEWLQWV